MRATVAVAGTNCHGFEALWDISKAFDRVDHGKLIEQASKLRYPLQGPSLVYSILQVV